MTTIHLPFEIGERVWQAAYETEPRRVPCPECAGTTVIQMTKGNGTVVMLDCAWCAPGYDPPSGYVTQYIPAFRPVPFTPRRWGMSGDEFTFSEADPSAQCYSFVYAKDLFKDLADCQKRCIELSARKLAEDKEREIHHLTSKRRSLAWSASYWSNQVRNLEKSLAAARERLAKCPKRAAVTVDAAHK